MTLAQAPSLTAWGRAMLLLPDDAALETATDRVEKGLVAMGLTDKMAVAYPQLYPLVKEHAAIQEATVWEPLLAEATPSVETPGDAAMLAQMEHQMPKEDARRLAAMLPFPGLPMSEEGTKAEALWPKSATTKATRPEAPPPTRVREMLRQGASTPTLAAMLPPPPRASA